MQAWEVVAGSGRKRRLLEAGIVHYWGRSLQHHGTSLSRTGMPLSHGISQNAGDTKTSPMSATQLCAFLHAFLGPIDVSYGFHQFMLCNTPLS